MGQSSNFLNFHGSQGNVSFAIDSAGYGNSPEDDLYSYPPKIKSEFELVYLAEMGDMLLQTRTGKI